MSLGGLVLEAFFLVVSSCVVGGGYFFIQMSGGCVAVFMLSM